MSTPFVLLQCYYLPSMFHGVLVGCQFTLLSASLVRLSSIYHFCEFTGNPKHWHLPLHLSSPVYQFCRLPQLAVDSTHLFSQRGCLEVTQVVESDVRTGSDSSQQNVLFPTSTWKTMANDTCVRSTFVFYSSEINIKL